MITYSNKSIFNVRVDAIVNTINCIGKMGGGIALECSARFPRMFEQYKLDCENNLIHIGKTYMYEECGTKIICFPTKDNNKLPSEISYIESGLDYFVNNYKQYNIKSVAFPLLGCRNGGLDFLTQVKPIMEEKLKDLDLNVIICLNTEGPDYIETMMIDKIRNIDLDEMANKLDIEKEFTDRLKGILDNIDRFENIKSKTLIWNADDYRKIYHYIKNLCLKTN